MVPNRKGMTALIDAMAFLVIMIAVMSITYGYADLEKDDASAGDILETISEVEVRLSDMVDVKDDSVVMLTDLIALDIMSDGHRTLDYVIDILDVSCHGRMYRLDLGFDGRTVSLGGEVEGRCTEYSCECFVSTGGKLTMVLRISS